MRDFPLSLLFHPSLVERPDLVLLHPLLSLMSVSALIGVAWPLRRGTRIAGDDLAVPSAGAWTA